MSALFKKSINYKKYEHAFQKYLSFFIKQYVRNAYHVKNDQQVSRKKSYACAMRTERSRHLLKNKKEN